MSFSLICAVYEVFDHIKTMQKCVHFTNSIKHNTLIYKYINGLQEEHDLIFEICFFKHKTVSVMMTLTVVLHTYHLTRFTDRYISHTI